MSAIRPVTRCDRCGRAKDPHQLTRTQVITRSTLGPLHQNLCRTCHQNQTKNPLGAPRD